MHAHKKGAYQMNYFATHWKGELSLPKSALLNGLVAYLVLVLALVFFGQLFSSSIFLAVGLSVFGLWLGWALVGIARCSIRIAQEPDSSLLRRASGVLGLLGVIVVIALSASDVWNLL